MTRRQPIQGYTCSKSKQVVDASSQMFLDQMPPILVFHLKLFDYDVETGANKKLLKRIQFNENFEFPRESLIREVPRSMRTYKLLAGKLKGIRVTF